MMQDTKKWASFEVNNIVNRYFIQEECVHHMLTEIEILIKVTNDLAYLQDRTIDALKVLLKAQANRQASKRLPTVST